jgi:hypothetical protein
MAQERHNIIQIHDNVMWTDNITWNISHIESECREYMGMFCEILLVLQNIFMDMSNVMDI